MGEQALLPAGQEDGVELEALGAVQGHQVDLVAGAARLVLHDQADVLEKCLQGLELAERRHQLAQVVEPPRRLGRGAVPPHGGVPGLVEHRRRQLRRRRRLGQAAPALEGVEQGAEGAPRLRGQLVAAGQAAPGDGQRHPVGPGQAVQGLKARLADAALRRVDDALESEVVVGLADDAQVGDGVADLQALVEARTADDPIGDTEGDQALLELARLEAGAHQHRDLVQGMARLGQG